MATQLGSVIDGKYRVIEKIGEGGMSVVWLVTDSRLNKQWAIKEIKKNAKTETHKVIVGSMRSEANLMKGLDHPALPRVVDIIEDGESLFVVMDFIQGKDLSTVMKKRLIPYTEADVVDWGIQLCDALTYLHNRGIVYRDMKPGNVMLLDDGTVKIIDFGIAREYSPDKEDDTMPLGTRGYASPEAFKRGIQTTPVSDVYSLGVTLFHLVTGIGPMQFVDRPSLPPIREINPALSEGLEYVIIKATQWNPADRYQSCEEMRYDLEHLDELTAAHRRRLQRTLNLFKGLVIAAIVCAVLGAIAMVASNIVLSNTYEDIVKNAREASNAAPSSARDVSEAEALYEQAIEVNPGDIQSYASLVELYREDGLFTQGEKDQWNRIDKNHKRSIEGNDQYANLCYEVGFTYYNFPDSEQADEWDGYASAKTWFDRAIAAHEGGLPLDGSKETAIKAYQTVANNPFTSDALEDEGLQESLKSYWDALEDACNVYDSIGEGEMPLARLRLYKTIFNVIETRTYLSAFKGVGIQEERVRALLDKIETNTKNLAAIALGIDDAREAYEEIVNNEEAAIESIETAYYVKQSTSSPDDSETTGTTSVQNSGPSASGSGVN